MSPIVIIQKPGRQAARVKLRPRAARRGFTLMETMVAMVLASMILGGVTDLFMTAARLANRSNALIVSTLSSANAVQKIISVTQEGAALDLPDDANFTPLSGFGNISSNYKTTVNGSTVLTALEIELPARQTETVLDSSGNAISLPTTSATNVVYDRHANSSDHILFYRGNADQSPNPATGQYLWMYQASSSATTLICRNIAAASGASVQFYQPPGGSSEVEAKIVCSEYSLTNGQQSSEETDGSTTSALTGKCALMRDYIVNSGSSDQGTTNHAFQKT